LNYENKYFLKLKEILIIKKYVTV